MTPFGNAPWEEPPPARPAKTRDKHERWNYWTVALYLSCHRIGLILVQPDTVLPVLLLHLTSHPILLGAPSSLYLFFWTFPQSLIAFYTTRVRETKPLVTLLMILHALPWAALSFYLVSCWRGGAAVVKPLPTVLAVYAAVVAYSILGGASTPGYMTMVGKTLVARSQIKLMGYVWCTSVVLTFGASLLMRRLIADAPFPLNFAIMFLAGFGVYCMAIAFWGETKEPTAGDGGEVHPTLHGYYRDVFASIRRERRFRRFLLSITLSGFALPLLMPFLAVHAIDELKNPPETIAVFLLILMVCQSVAGYVTGRFLPDRSAILGLFISMCFTAAVAFTLLAPLLPGRIWLAYGLAGLAQGFFQASFQPAMFEVAGRRNVGVVIGVTNTIRAPFYASGPFVGGVLQMKFGFAAVAATCLAFSLAALLAMRPVAIAREG